MKQIIGLYTEQRLINFVNIFKLIYVYANQKTKDKITPNILYGDSIMRQTASFVDKYINKIKIDNSLKDNCIKGFDGEKEYFWNIMSEQNINFSLENRDGNK